MYNSFNVEAEHNELILKNSHGDHVIIPANKRGWVLKKIKEGCNTCIDSLVETLPIASEYAEYGSVYGSGDPKEKPSQGDKNIKDNDKIKEIEEWVENYNKYWDKKNKGKDTSEFDNDKMRKYTKKLSWEDAILYAKLKGLNNSELAEFLTRNVEMGNAIRTPEKWVKEVQNSDYVPPITKEEIESYNNYQAGLSKMKDTSIFNEYADYVNKSGYFKKGGQEQKLTGEQILKNALAANPNLKIIKNEDGSFSFGDDITTYTDTDSSFGKQRTFYPNATYSKTMYGKGRDLVNVYNFSEPPKYDKRVPTQDEINEYNSGNYYQQGLTPQNKVVYINKYVTPTTNQTFYGGGSEDDINRYKSAIDLSNRINEFYKSDEGKKYIESMKKNNYSSSRKRPPMIEEAIKYIKQQYR